MVVDTDGEKCVTASFVFGLSGLTREYEIRVLQYSKQNELGGPQGCLQFLVDERATVSSFNWAAGNYTLKQCAPMIACEGIIVSQSRYVCQYIK